MKILIYSAKDFEIPFLEIANNEDFQIKYIPERLSARTAMLSLGFDVISIFSADDASSKVLRLLKDFGVQYITLRSAGYDNIHLKTAEKLGIRVAHAPDYSPNAIAEHAVGLLLAMNRKLITTHSQVASYNFSLSNLVGFNLQYKTIGIIGVGRIGKVMAKILHGFECKLLGYDIEEHADVARKYGLTYSNLTDLCKKSDIIMLAVPLTTETHHLINADLIQLMKREVLIINIARGAIVHTKELIEAIELKRIMGYATDVYEYEHQVFFYDRSGDKPDDELLRKLIEMPNVLITPHQAFATKEALQNIAEATFDSIRSWQRGDIANYELTLEVV